MDDEINLLDYIKIIFKYRYLILAVTIIVTLSAAILFYGAEPPLPTYSATVAILPVDANASIYGYSFMWRGGGGMFNDIIRSRALASRVVEDMDLLRIFRERYRKTDMGGKEPVITLEQGAQMLRGMVQIKQAKDAAGLDITVMAWEPALAANIANAYVRNLKGFLTSNSLNLSFLVLDPALPSSAPVSLQKKNKILIAGASGLLGGIFLAFMIEYFTNVINEQNKGTYAKEIKRV